MDKHHVIHERRLHSARPELKKIRNTPSLIPLIDRDTHEALHRNCPAIPVLSYQAIVRTLGAFDPTEDTIQTIGRLQGAVEYAVDHPKAHPIERDLGQLVIQSLELQKPFLRPSYEGNVIDLGSYRSARE